MQSTTTGHALRRPVLWFLGGTLNCNPRRLEVGLRTVCMKLSPHQTVLTFGICFWTGLEDLWPVD